MLLQVTVHSVDHLECFNDAAGRLQECTCYYAYCGEGECSKNLTYGQICKCKPGYPNLLNITAFRCFSECALGSDYERLGINVSRSTSDDNNKNNDNQGA